MRIWVSLIEIMPVMGFNVANKAGNEYPVCEGYEGHAIAVIYTLILPLPPVPEFT